MISIYAIFALLILAQGTILHLLPKLMRQHTFFGVTVSPEYRFSSEAVALIHRFQLHIWAWTAFTLVAAVIAVRAKSDWFFIGAGPLLQILGASLAYISAWRRVRVHSIGKAIIRVAKIDETSFRDHPAEVLPTAILLFVIPAVTAVYLYLHWDQIPAHFPVHWNAAGKPNGWRERSVGGVYSPLIFGALVSALIFATRIAITVGAPRSTSRNSRVTMRVLMLVGLIVTVISGWVSLFPLMPPSARLAFLWTVPVMVLASIAYSIWLMTNHAYEPCDDSETRPTPDECWKYGNFYFNPDDPAFLVEKRAGIGYTFNFANKLSWLILGAALLLPLAVLLLRGVI